MLPKWMWHCCVIQQRYEGHYTATHSLSARPQTQSQAAAHALFIADGMINGRSSPLQQQLHLQAVRAQLHPWAEAGAGAVCASS